jgi:hypothetical protein
MTIRKTIDLSQTVKDYQNFRTAMEEAPEGTFQATRRMFRSLDAGVGDLLNTFNFDGLVYDKCDQIFEIEAQLFQMLRDNNPILQNEIATAVGLGETLSTASAETRRRVLDGLARDRAFLAKLEEA